MITPTMVDCSRRSLRFHEFGVVSGAEDDGEKYAGGRVLRVMQAEGVIDAVVVVSRWCVCRRCGGSG